MFHFIKVTDSRRMHLIKTKVSKMLVEKKMVIPFFRNVLHLFLVLTFPRILLDKIDFFQNICIFYALNHKRTFESIHKPDKYEINLGLKDDNFLEKYYYKKL